MRKYINFFKFDLKRRPFDAIVIILIAILTSCLSFISLSFHQNGFVSQKLNELTPYKTEVTSGFFSNPNCIEDNSKDNYRWYIERIDYISNWTSTKADYTTTLMSEVDGQNIAVVDVSAIILDQSVVVDRDLVSDVLDNCILINENSSLASNDKKSIIIEGVECKIIGSFNQTKDYSLGNSEIGEFVDFIVSDSLIEKFIDNCDDECLNVLISKVCFFSDSITQHNAIKELLEREEDVWINHFSDSSKTPSLSYVQFDNNERLFVNNFTKMYYYAALLSALSGIILFGFVSFYLINNRKADSQLLTILSENKIEIVLRMFLSYVPIVLVGVIFGGLLGIIVTKYQAIRIIDNVYEIQNVISTIMKTNMPNIEPMLIGDGILSLAKEVIIVMLVFSMIILVWTSSLVIENKKTNIERLRRY